MAMTTISDIAGWASTMFVVASFENERDVAKLERVIEDIEQVTEALRCSLDRLSKEVGRDAA